MHTMRIRRYLVKASGEIIYCIVAIVYLIRLHLLNQELAQQEVDGAFELLQYKECAPIKFFAVAVILFSFGCFFEYRRIRFIHKHVSAFEDMVISLLIVALIGVLLILLIAFIDNPILRAVFVLVLVILGLSILEG